MAWSKAVRSYLTKNRISGPDGVVPKDLDEQEMVSQAWMEAFAPACSLEAAGKKAEARVRAAEIGVEVLAKLDAKGCQRFLKYYMEADNAESICTAASGGASTDWKDRLASDLGDK
jgi:hypothetical protein